MIIKTKRMLGKRTYISLSVGIAFLVIFTALPYYCLTSIAIPEWNIYWRYKDVQRNMLILFPALSFFGAVTTLKKKNYIEDIFLNIAFPLIILLILKVMQYRITLIIVIIIIVGLFSLYKGIQYIYSTKYSKRQFKRIRIGYYICRKRAIYLLLFILSPMAVWVNYHESTVNGRILFESTAIKTADENEIVSNYNLVSEDQWEKMEVASRFEIMKNFTNDKCNDLGVASVDLYGIKELTNRTLAYYSHGEGAVYYNIIYLAKCSLEEALHVACHEIYHRYEHAVIDSLKVLEEAGIAYESLDYFAEAIEIKKASDNYYLDSLSYDTYSQNLLEILADEYADQEINTLKESGYLIKE